MVGRKNLRSLILSRVVTHSRLSFSVGLPSPHLHLLRIPISPSCISSAAPSPTASGMAGVGWRRPFPDRLAWIRRRTWSKQRSAKLRGSSSETDGNPKPVVKPAVHDGDVASKHALKLGSDGDDGTL